MHQPTTPQLPLPPWQASVLVALLIHWLWWPVTTIDLPLYLIPWLEHIRATGPFEAFATPFSNYMPPYLYLLSAISPLAEWLPPVTVIKLLSLCGTLVLAAAIRHLCTRLTVDQPTRAAALFLIVPSVAANAGLLGQCDAWWSAPIVMALAAAIDRRHGRMLAWCGLAIAVKAQAAFIAPFFVALLIARRVPFGLWLIAPLAAIMPLLPAMLMGWPAGDLALVYLRQTEHFDALSLNAPNIWMIVQPLPMGGLPMGGIALFAAAGAAIWYILRFSVILRTAPPWAMIAIAALAPLIMCGLLPRMHERFFFIADVLAILLAICRRDCWRVAACVQAGSCLAIFGYLIGIDAFAIVGALIMILGTLQLARAVLPTSPDRAIPATPMKSISS